MSRSTAIIEALKAETLLAGSFVLTQIESLRANLLYSSNGEKISFDDYYLKLQDQVDKLPKLKLERTVAKGTENQYIMQLVDALEQILDTSDELVRKIIHYQSKLKNAQGQIKKLSAAFNAWYTLAASEALEENGAKFPSNQLKDLANSEFSRLMRNADVETESLLSAVLVQGDQIKQWKKTQQDKFDMGKDQANASWTSALPNFGQSSERSNQLLETPKFKVEEEEPDTDVPQFVSKRPTLDTLRAENKAEDAKRPVGQVIDRSSGLDFSAEAARQAKAALPEIKGTFVKTGDPKPIVPVLSDNGPGQAVLEAAIPVQEYSPESIKVLEGMTKPVAPEMDIDKAAPVIQPAPPATDLASAPPADFKSVFGSAIDVTDAKPAAPPAPKVAKPKKDAIIYRIPTDNDPIVLRDSDPAEKIKCVVCDRRIRSKQEMFARDGGWAHVNEGECTGAPVIHRGHSDVDEPGGVMAASPDIVKAAGSTDQGALFGAGLAIAKAVAAPASQGTVLADLEAKAVPSKGTIVPVPATPEPPAIPEPDAPATPRKRLTFLDEGDDVL